MRLAAPLFSLLATSVLSGAVRQFNSRDFINTTGLTDAIGWDKYSFFIHGKRVFVQSGEFHPWRIPVPDLWKDITQKAKAAGLNTLSTYMHWHLHNPKAGVIDTTGILDLQKFFDDAKDAGLWVIARPGPYINSETSSGGVPGHVLTIPGDPTWNPYNGELRSNDTFYHDAWQDYWNSVITIIAKNQISNGGPVIMLQIENEYYNGPGQNQYVDELRQRAVDLGIVVPTTVNDPGEFRNLVNDADIYGIDAYPNSLSCANPTVWRNVPNNWRSYHESVTPEIPFMFPEFQGGSSDAWNSTGGYAACRELTNTNFQRVYYHALWANGVTAESFYMFYGGTSWGQLPYSNGYTSYDYGAPVNEARAITAKHAELKLQSLFLRSFPDLRMTNLIVEDNTTVSGVTTTHLQNPSTNSSFYITRHTDTTVNNTLTFNLVIGANNTVVPQLGGNLTLLGRDSFVMVTDLEFGASKLQYSTATVLSNIKLGKQDLLITYGNAGLVYEVALASNVAPKVTVSGPTQIQSKFIQDSIILKFVIAPGITTVTLGGMGTPVVLLIADYDTAGRFWMPTIAGAGQFANFVDVSASAPLLLSGPYLVRSASLTGSTLSLTGDLDGPTNLTVFGPSSYRSITWNGKKVTGVSSVSSGISSAKVGTQESLPAVPNLMQQEWKFADSLPEIRANFDDSAMVPADHTNTTSVFPPYYGEPWILYADDYGFHAGNLVWRGSFMNNANMAAPTAVNLSISGGAFHAASAWLNDHYLGFADTQLATNNKSFPVTSDMLVDGVNNVTVLQDNMGGNLAGQLVCCTPGGRQRDIQQPRGIQGYFLVGRSADDQFTGWKLAGNFKGENFPDSTRKILNEGGLFAERQGWHLPGFDDSAWESRMPFQGLDGPGVGFFRTTFNLSLPEGSDTQLSVAFNSQPGHYRAQLYVNGWQMGKRVANIGPQTSFVVHEGILNFHGENVIAVSLWALEGSEADVKIPSLNLVATSSVQGGVGSISSHNPSWGELRN